MFLDKIPVEEYVKFTIEKFTLAEKKISEELIVQLNKKVSDHTWYVQYMLNRLYTLPVSCYSTMEVDEVVRQVLMENEPFYEGYTKLVTSRQWALMEAIAQEGVVLKPNSQQFIN